MNEIIELMDIVSDTDEVIGQIDRSLLGLGKNPGFRVINAFLMNGNGELWIPRRHSNKQFFPLHLDASVGGHVMSGETYEEALVREAEEEVRLKVTTFKQIGRLTPHDDNVSAFMKVYLIRCDVTPEYNTDDFSGYYWLKPGELLDRIRGGDKAKGDLEIIVKKVFLA